MENETNEPTNKGDTNGTEPNKVLPTSDKPVAKDGEPLSDYDKALALVKRREEATKAENEVLERKEKLAANAMLGGTSGGHVEAPLVSPEDKKVENAKELFKNTALGDAITEVNKKK